MESTVCVREVPCASRAAAPCGPPSKQSSSLAPPRGRHVGTSCRQTCGGRHGFSGVCLQNWGQQRPALRAAASAGDGGRDEVNGEWASSAIPSYLYEASQCGTFHTWLQDAASLRGDGKPMSSEEYRDMMRRNPVWLAILAEAERDAAEEPILSSFLWASVLSHESFERSLAFVLANRLADATMMATELFDVFYSVLKSSPETIAASLTDCQAAMERDPACTGYSQALLYYKGFHALQAQRIAHVLWNQGRRVLALALQSRVSEVLSVDIHPATRLGTGILLDHGTGIVIGETAVVGNNCSLLQGVTLGGTGKSSGDRHPKVGAGVLIGANATVLGNIPVGNGAQIAAGSLVLKPVPEWGIVAGSPAKLVGQVAGGPPALEMKQWIKEVDQDPYDTTPSMELSNADLKPRRSPPGSSAGATKQTSASGESTEAQQEWGSNVNGHPVKPAGDPTAEIAGLKLVVEAEAALRASFHSLDLDEGELPDLDARHKSPDVEEEEEAEDHPALEGRHSLELDSDSAALAQQAKQAGDAKAAAAAEKPRPMVSRGMGMFQSKSGVAPSRKPSTIKPVNGAARPKPKDTPSFDMDEDSIEYNL